jgi:hypothetical protein
MAKGDHIFVPLVGETTHHGIDVGDGTVVHWHSGRSGKKSFKDLLGRKSEAEIRRTPLDEEHFGDLSRLQVREYSNPSDADEVVNRALSRVGEQGYSLCWNNCEHFANWCKTGSSESAQVQMVSRGLAAFGTRCLANVGSKMLTRSGSKREGKALEQGTSPLFLLADLAQATTELKALNSGTNPDCAKQIGRGVGAASSLAIGAAIGGPIGAGLGLGFWVIGELVGKAISG